MTSSHASGRIPVVLSWSGGKDSSLALQALRANSRYDVVALLTSVTSDYARVSIHGVRRALLEAQTRALGLPLFEVSLEAKTSNDAYETAFRRALLDVKRAFPGLRHIAFGDLYLADVRTYRERLVWECGMEPLFPVWGLDTAVLARRFITEGYRAHLVCVDTTRLDATFAGRVFDDTLLANLPAGVDPCGEGGEFHTFVSTGPIFSEEIAVEVGDLVVREERFAYRDLLQVAPEGGRASTGTTCMTRQQSSRVRSQAQISAAKLEEYLAAGNRRESIRIARANSHPEVGERAAARETPS